MNINSIALNGVNTLNFERKIPMYKRFAPENKYVMSYNCINTNDEVLDSEVIAEVAKIQARVMRAGMIPTFDYFKVSSDTKKLVENFGTAAVLFSPEALKLATQNGIFKKVNEINDKILTPEEEKRESINLFNFFGIKTKELSDGTLAISKYVQPGKNVTFSDLNIDENKLLKYVSSIEGDAYFTDSNVTNLSNLKQIKGNACFHGCKDIDISGLYRIGGYADFSQSQIKNANNLRFIGGFANFGVSLMEDLSSLEYIGGQANFSCSEIKCVAPNLVIRGHLMADMSKFNVLKNAKLKSDVDFSSNFDDINNRRKAKRIAGLPC